MPAPKYNQWWYSPATFKIFSKHTIAFNPKEDKILIGSMNRANLWAFNGNILTTFWHDKAVNLASFNHKGDKVLTSSADKTAKLWNLNGDLLANLKHNDAVNSAVFSPQDDKILTISDKDIAQLWNLNGNLLAIFRHNGKVTSGAFGPEGDKILTGSDDKTAKLWVLYKNPTFEQVLLRRLINLYLEAEKPSKQIQSHEMLLKAISR